MSKVHSFTLREHEDFGTMGWVLDRKPYFDPMDGMGVAHDVLEEFPNGGEQPHDELMAMGALIYGRGSMSGAFNRRPLHEVVGSELHEMMRHVYDEDNYYLAEAPKTRRLPEDFEDIEDTIQGAIQYAREYFPRTIESGEFTEEAVAEIVEWLPHAENWLRIGFRRARRRFEPHWDGCDVAYMFDRIRDEVDLILKREEPQEFDKLRVIVSYQRHDLLVVHERAYAW